MGTAVHTLNYTTVNIVCSCMAVHVSNAYDVGVWLGRMTWWPRYMPQALDGRNRQSQWLGCILIAPRAPAAPPVVQTGAMVEVEKFLPLGPRMWHALLLPKVAIL